MLGTRGQYCLDFGGMKLFVRPNTSDLQVVRSCLLGEFDSVLNLTPATHGFIIDAGGYIGVSSIIFAIWNPSATIVCLEPSLENYELAKRNCAPWPNIHVLNCALAATAGLVTLKDRGTGHWGYTIVDPDDEANLVSVGQVETISVPEIMRRYNKTGIDLLKLDIEGAECEVLKSLSLSYMIASGLSVLGRSSTRPRGVETFGRKVKREYR
jgi:FkbM family methyltransferase